MLAGRVYRKLLPNSARGSPARRRIMGAYRIWLSSVCHMAVGRNVRWRVVPTLAAGHIGHLAAELSAPYGRSRPDTVIVITRAEKAGQAC